MAMKIIAAICHCIATRTRVIVCLVHAVAVVVWISAIGITIIMAIAILKGKIHAVHGTCQVLHGWIEPWGWTGVDAWTLDVPVRRHAVA